MSSEQNAANELNALRERIRAAFDLFDKDKKNFVIQEEVSTIMRYLGAYPSERDVVEKIIPEIQEDEPAAYVTYDKFERKMIEVLSSHEYDPDTDDTLLQAFRVLDADGNGMINANHIRELLVTKGTPFRDKEIDAFMSVAKDLETQHIYYEDYVALLTAEAENIGKQQQ